VYDGCGQNLLHYACYCKYNFKPVDNRNLYDTLRLLLNAGCDPNATDQNGNAPLRFLAQLDHRRFDDLGIFVHLLLDFGAQLSHKNKVGKSAVDMWILRNGRKRPCGIIGCKLPDCCTIELPTLRSA